MTTADPSTMAASAPPSVRMTISASIPLRKVHVFCRTRAALYFLLLAAHLVGTGIIQGIGQVPTMTTIKSWSLAIRAHGISALANGPKLFAPRKRIGRGCSGSTFFNSSLRALAAFRVFGEAPLFAKMRTPSSNPQFANILPSTDQSPMSRKMFARTDQVPSFSKVSLAKLLEPPGGAEKRHCSTTTFCPAYGDTALAIDSLEVLSKNPRGVTAFRRKEIPLASFITASEEPCAVPAALSAFSAESSAASACD